MILLDTNVFIYLANGTINATKVKDTDISYASITKIEALGYMHITAAEQNYLEELFAECEQFDLDEKIIKQAIRLRQRHKMTLGDAIVAATAIAYDLELWTANIEDFEEIENLRIKNPLHSS